MSNGNAKQVRVRFAPSPSGKIHIGNLRTALMNWLIARRFGGVFVLRIEDTDSTNRSEANVEAIMRDLEWTGLDWDEGEGAGGEFGPYRQSERTNIYRQRLEELYEQGMVYPCFCSKERLDELRAIQRARGQMPHYDNRCRSIPPGEARARMEAGESHTWRFRLPDSGSIEFEDLLHGKKSFPVDSLGGDPVIVRSNGDFLFIFAGAVDDVEMKISHVVRGEDHLSNTARQVQIIRALGGTEPAYVHMPLIVGNDKKPLSKRNGSVSVEQLRSVGVLPEALLNYVARLGFSPPESLPELFLPAELAKAFEFTGLSRSPAMYEYSQLLNLNAKYISSMTCNELLSVARRFLEPELAKARPSMDEPVLCRILEVVKPEARLLSDLPRLVHPFLPGIELDFSEVADMLSLDEAKRFANALEAVVEEGFDSSSQFLARMKELTHTKGAKLYKPIRAMLTGAKHGPPIGDLIELLPPAELVRRAGQFVKFLELRS